MFLNKMCILDNNKMAICSNSLSIVSIYNGYKSTTRNLLLIRISHTNRQAKYAVQQTSNTQLVFNIEWRPAHIATQN